VITLCPLGRYAHRQPFAYAPIRRLLAGELRLSDDPQEADILLLAHSKDLQTEAGMLAVFPDKKILLLSEEPFWDTIWAEDPFTREQHYTGQGGDFDFTFLNHHNSDIFAFDRIPYYLQTDYRFAPRYGLRFGRNRHKTTADWRRHFEQSRWQAAFIAEKRLNEKFAVSFPEQDTYGLCRFRSQLTEACPGAVYRGGKGWRKGGLRQELDDWHLDKLLQLDGKCRFVSGLENTHQVTYLSEKLFDAFAVGGVPLFYGSNRHRLHRLVPDEAWLNLFGMSVDQAVVAIADFRFDAAFLEAYVAAQNRLAEIFCTPDALVCENDRLAQALRGELQRL